MKTHTNLKILITGGSGFIGSHLARKFVENNAEVHIYDRLAPNALRKINDATYHQHDIRDEKALDQILRLGFDHVFHLAAISNVVECSENPVESFEINTLATIQLVEKIRVLEKIPNLIYASSSAVYGSQALGDQAIKENQVEPKPTSFYGYQKWISEKTVLEAAHSANLPFFSFRFFNVYGPHQDPKSAYTGVITKFINNLSSGKKIEIHGDGSQTRDFVHIHDVVEALFCTLGHRKPFPGKYSLNIGSNRSISILALAKLISKLTGKKSDFEFKPKREGDVPYSLAAIDQAKKLLNWNPKIDLEKGMYDLIPLKNKNQTTVLQSP